MGAVLPKKLEEHPVPFRVFRKWTEGRMSAGSIRRPAPRRTGHVTFANENLIGWIVDNSYAHLSAEDGLR